MKGNQVNSPRQIGRLYIRVKRPWNPITSNDAWGGKKKGPRKRQPGKKHSFIKGVGKSMLGTSYV